MTVDEARRLLDRVLFAGEGTSNNGSLEQAIRLVALDEVQKAIRRGVKI